MSKKTSVLSKINLLNPDRRKLSNEVLTPRQYDLGHFVTQIFLGLRFTINEHEHLDSNFKSLPTLRSLLSVVMFYFN